MTGIVVDVFKNNVYMFADGRVTADDYIVTDNDTKIIKPTDSLLVTNTGEASLLDSALHVLASNGFLLENVPVEDISDIKGSGTVILVSGTMIQEWYIYNNPETKDSISNNAKATYRLNTLPMFFGSGTEALSGAYEGKSPKTVKSGKKLKKASELDYLEAMGEVFSAAARRISSMGSLNQFESIKVTKTTK